MAYARILQDHLLVRVTLDTNLMLMVLHVQVIHEHHWFPKIDVERLICKIFSTFTDKLKEVSDIHLHGSNMTDF
jgi:hypothetical protein